MSHFKQSLSSSADRLIKGQASDKVSIDELYVNGTAYPFGHTERAEIKLELHLKMYAIETGQIDWITKVQGHLYKVLDASGKKTIEIKQSRWALQI